MTRSSAVRRAPTGPRFRQRRRWRIRPAKSRADWPSHVSRASGHPASGAGCGARAERRPARGAMSTRAPTRAPPPERQPGPTPAGASGFFSPVRSWRSRRRRPDLPGRLAHRRYRGAVAERPSAGIGEAAARPALASRAAAPSSPARATALPRWRPMRWRPGRPGAGEHLEEHAAERPDVRPPIDGLASRLLRTHVRREPMTAPACVALAV